MGAGDASQLRGPVEPGEGGKLAHVDFIGAAGLGIGEVSEPFELGRNLGEGAVLRRGQRTPINRPARVSNRHQVLGHAAPPCFYVALPGFQTR